MDNGYKVVGYKKAIKNLQAIGIPSKAIKEAGQRAGEIVANEARPLVPVLKGKLKRSIVSRKLLNEVKVQAGSTSVPYANLIHWGSKKRGVNRNPFFYRALAFTRKEVLEVYTKEMQQLIAQQSTKGKPNGD